MRALFSLCIVGFVFFNACTVNTSGNTNDESIAPVGNSGSQNGDDSQASGDVKTSTTDCVSITTNKGNIDVALDGVNAPESVSNFLAYVNAGFYDNTIFHRVIKNFMIQGGGYTQEFVRKQANAPIVNEADNGLLNKRGSIAMARLSEPHSATSQFFINSVDNSNLDYVSQTPEGWGYAVFGNVLEGMNVVDEISSSPTGAGGPFIQDVPNEAILIQSVNEIACS